MDPALSNLAWERAENKGSNQTLMPDWGVGLVAGFGDRFVVGKGKCNKGKTIMSFLRDMISSGLRCGREMSILGT